MRYLAPLLLVLLAALPTAPVANTQPVRNDDRTGTVVDKQGTALVRPVGRQRWSPVRQKTVLVPGDQLRTPTRGANAVEVRLAGGGSLVLGPGSLVELSKRGALRLYRGELEVKAEKNKVVLTGPGGFEGEVAAGKTMMARAKDRKTIILKQAPRWLSGYRNSTTDEWMGSLIAKVDGRDVPLSVGYHKVDVVIRDQIAQTTVEQSFLNSTKNRLEGVFYFPLPADASISGFGMWIGGELVEADLVEKERAREIYEDILRRKKDPGLLEWSGGNLFKARVFPIEPHSEKRVRIRYTQVLPLEGSLVRYRYALRSELLRSRPLKKLQLKVTVSSSMPITGASSPSHEMRIRHTPDAAVMEFDAEEHSPERDFEAVVELDRSDTLTVVPHRREDDGYFMMLLSPPGQAGGKWQRELMPEGKAMDVLILADTSGSMDTAARQAQSTFIRGLLSLLGSKDTFQLLTCDVDVHAFADQPQPTAKADKALDFLEARPSLGWTDLDLAMQKVLKRLHENTVVIYVGDGIGTTGDADPVALANRLKRLAKEKNNVFHAVSTGSTYEKVVLETIAALGGGSVRAVGDDPAQTAYALLAESAQPAVKNLKVSFEGLRVARVYPEQLPNLPIGTQQVILGRFLPTGKDQSGNVVVTGTLEGKPVRYTARLKIRAHETGNSFTPRLWARRHLDYLLAQGRSAQMKEDIVAFSQEFGIMTPYTSFLVLESDEDRKRYGVERRVSMRDGERFFAQGRDAASTAILRQQMKLARTWRLNLRYQMLREIAKLGRDLHGWSVAIAPPVTKTRPHAEANLGFGARGGGRRYRSDVGISGGESERLATTAKARSTPAPGAMADKTLEAGEVMDEDVEVEEFEEEAQEEGRFAPAERAANLVPARKRRGRRPAGYADFDMEDSYGWAGGKRLRRELEVYPALTFASMGFPPLGRPAKEPLKLDDPKWPADVLAILRSLDRRPVLAKIEGGLELTRTQESLHAVQGRVTNWSTHRLLYTAESWLSQSEGRGAQPTRSWLLQGKRGVAVLGLKLGRVRDGVERDRRFSLDLSDYSTTDLVQGWRHYRVTKKDLDGDLVQLTFTAPAPQRSQFRLEIDTRKKVVVKSTSYDSDFRVNQTSTYSDFVEVAGTWWAQKIEQRNEKNQVFHRQKLTVKGASKDAALAAMTKAAAEHSKVLFIGAIDPKLADAKQSVHENKAGFAEHMRIALHYAATQQWEKVWANADRANRAAEDKFAVPFLTAWLRTHSRRGQEFGEGLAVLVETAKSANVDTRDFLAAHLRQLGGKVLGTNEQLALLENLESIYQTGGRDAAWRDLEYRTSKARLLWNLGNKEEALGLRKETAARYPVHMRAVNDYLQALVNTADLEGAVRYADEVLRPKDRWLESEIDTVFHQWTEGLWRLRRLPELLRVAKRWHDRRPENQQAYVRYASTLLFNNQEKAADDWIKRHLDDERAKISRAYQRELQAAIHLALGSGWNFQTNGIQKKWLEPLAKLARRLARTEGNTLQLAQSIVGNWRFRRTDQYRELRKWFLQDLMKDGVIAEMSLQRLGYYLQWISWHKDHVAKADWQKVTGLIRSRFDATSDKDEQHKLGEHVLRLLDVRQEKKEALAFLRHWRKVALEQKDHVTRQLFDRLAREEWTEELQTELFQLVPALQPEKARDHQHQSIAAGAARLLAANLFKSRVKALLGPVEKLEKLPRAERREKTKVSQAQARAELAKAFGDAARTTDKWARPWLTLEGLCFAAQTKKDLAAAANRAKELLAAVPKVDPDEDPQKAYMPLILRRRCAVLLAYTASRRATPEGVADQVLDVYAAGEKADKEQKLLNWRYQTFRLLVALDRTKKLETLLSSWIQPGKAETAWCKALAYLKAEGGKLKEAVAAFESVESVDELGSKDYENLANWYLVLGDDARREKALLNRYQVMSIYQIARRISSERQRVSSRGGNNVPQTLDPDVLRAERVLLSKAPRPRDYVWYVRNLYRSVKDFRLLEALPYGVVGHTPEGIYTFLSRVGQILNNVHEEATCDALVAAIHAQAQTTDRTVDQRGLLLLTAMVERRAARVLNAPGGHVRKGLAAMRTAFKGSWLPGERAHMAGYLYSLGKIRHPEFAQEQLRQLKELYVQAEGTPANKLTLAYHLARTYWRYDRKNDAVSTLEMALANYKRANSDVLRSSANHTVNTLVRYMEGSGRYAAAETFLRKQRADQVLQSQKDWYRQRIYQLYTNCLLKRGSLSLGKGEELYLAARDEMRAWLWKCGFDQMNATLNKLCGLHRVAHKVHIIRSGKDLQTWTREAMPELATRFVLDQAYRVRTVAGALATVRNHRVALGVLLDHIDREPSWLRRVRREGWSVYAWSIATHRYKAGRLGDLSPRLRKVALAELARDLSRMSWRNTSMFYRNNRYFWGAMSDQFGNVALDTIRNNQDSPARIMFAANYLWSGLRERDEAVGALTALDDRGKLPDSGRYRLAVWLQEMRRWRDSLGHLTKLIQKNPDNLDYRVRKVRAFFKTGQTEDAKTLLALTEKRFRDKKVWHVNVIVALANVAREGRYHDKGAALYEEAIRMYERSGRRRWNYRRTLSGYYTQWARCLTALNRMDEAVDAASAAVVAWGKDQKNRRKALAELRRVFRRMGDGVDDYVSRWNQKVAKTGLDAPVIRKMLGLVYMDSRRWSEAIQQLRIARELQPNDADVHQNLVKCFDRKGDRAGASKALLTSIAMSPMNLSLYTDLGRRLERAGDKTAAERAYTTMVEVKPNEAESHRLLGQLRERQRRYTDAVVQWQQVVRIRSKEPDGWLSLGHAQVKAGQLEDARKTVDHLLKTEWDKRFKNVDARARRLAQLVERSE